MVNYLSLILTSCLGLAMFIGLFYWGWLNDGFIRMLVGVLGMLSVARNGVRQLEFKIELNDWLKANENAVVFFYPSKKGIQAKIKEQVLSQIEPKPLVIYYEGPKLVGDVKLSVVRELMDWNARLQVNSPSIFRITNQLLILEPLPELFQIDQPAFDLEVVLNKIGNFLEESSSLQTR